MFGRKSCGCCGRFGGKNNHHNPITKKSAGRPESASTRTHITVDKAIGAGDMGVNRQPLLGNSTSGLANGQRDIVDFGNAQTAMQKRKTGANPIESSKRNKAQ